MSQHDRSFSLHVHAPSKVKQEIAETKHHSGIMETCVDLTEVRERPRTCDKRRSEAEGGGEEGVDYSNESAVPFSRSFAVECMKEKVRVSP